ncbi:MAG TPA: hypothetical protein VK212_05585 [Lentimicrobium sp.]|nr:hypothetical protein [Lentimicrobium sp.]
MTLVKQILILCLFTLSVMTLKGQNHIKAEGSKAAENVFIQQILTASDYFSNFQDHIDIPLLNGNVSQVTQIGNYNKSTVVQYGEENFTKVFQFGNYNESELEIFGNGNIAKIGQLGSYNIIEKTIRGDYKDFYLLQRGDGNKFLIEGDLPPGTRIIQQGGSMNIRIK